MTETNELFAAMAKAFPEIEGAIKDKANPAFKGTKYADLSAVMDAIKPALVKNGLGMANKALDAAVGGSWHWSKAPVKTQWGHEMVVADIAIDKDNTVSVYCERDQIAKVEAMFTPTAAQPAPVQEPVAWIDMSAWPPVRFREGVLRSDLEHLDGLPLCTTPPAAQRQWVGLTEDEIRKLRHLVDWTAEWSYGRFAYELEQLLREKNGGAA